MRRSKRTRPIAEDPNFHYSPAAKKPPALQTTNNLQRNWKCASEHGPVKACNLTSQQPISHADARITSVSEAISSLTAGVRAAGLSLQPWQIQKLHRPLNAVSFATELRDGCQPAELDSSRQPSGNASNDSSTDHIELAADCHPHSSLLLLRQAGPHLSSGKARAGRHNTSISSRRSRLKSKPVKAPSE